MAVPRPIDATVLVIIFGISLVFSVLFSAVQLVGLKNR
ncbi:hypothetical protein JCM19232_3182 [Vibrio ishigakensis]|uniref:Uncharacterized protein n=1 Tax=Vibrio ishigakensis TaxID=1481914 RepID=A0A0B8PQD7_9VIBR|nr:hypothetical protein JCM19232_3182 [Vibrio ishigakensis]GAM71005.1 hypothetical protein JCM19236_1172 [Vibrio sp. JCM 19236]